ncbi:MAG TPA: HD domain-containing phosphohydrolase, partial [Candidatus Xenobia bacterium]
EEIRYLALMADQVSVALTNCDAMRQLHAYFFQSIEFMVDCTQGQDPNSHSRQVAALSLNMAQQLGLGPEETDMLKFAALLHDVGELQTRKNDGQHPALAAQMLRKVSLFERLVPIIENHHERFDGKGYPNGRSGEDIPFLARVLAIAEAFYEDGPGKGPSGASMDEFLGRFGGAFDPNLRGTFQAAVS